MAAITNRRQKAHGGPEKLEEVRVPATNDPAQAAMAHQTGVKVHG